MKRRAIILGASTVIAADALSKPAIAEGQEVTYDSVTREVWAPIDADGGLRELVRAATLAANSHNTQPWQFVVTGRRITVLPDLSRRCPAVDPDDHHLFASLGCAAENVVHAAAIMGLKAAVVLDPASDRGLAVMLESAPVETSRLVSAITNRQCTRAEYDGKSVSADDLRRLEAAGTMDGVDCLLLTDRARMDRVLDYVVQGNSVQMNDEAFMTELKSWIRFSDAQAIQMRDGLSSRSSDNPSMPEWLARLLFPFVFTEKGENDKYAKHIRSSSGIAVFCSARNDEVHWMLAGRAYQRFALEATALGLKHAFINQPVEVPKLREQLGAFLGINDRRPDLVVRFGYGQYLPKSLRRPVDSVIVRPQ